MAPPLKPLRDLSYVPLGDVSADATFRLRQPGDVSSLARSIAQVGQLFPVDVRETEGGLQPLAGFRRIEALRLLQRSRVLVRNHGPLSDQSAAIVAAADAIDNRSLDLEDLRELHDRYVAMGWGTPALLELVARSIEKETERLEDLAARLKGEPPPDRSIADEDGDDDESAVVAAAPPPKSTEPATIIERSMGEATGESGVSARADAGKDSGADPRAAAAGADADMESGADPRAATAGADPDGDPAVGSDEPVDGVGAIGVEETRPEPLVATIELQPVPLDPPAAPRVSVAAARLVDDAEVTPDDLARQIAARLSEASQDLSLLADHWEALPPGLRTILADQLDYYGRLSGWLSPDGEDA